MVGLFAGILSFVVQAQAGNFPDVPAGHWAASAVLDLKKEGILVGYPNRSFSKQALAKQDDLTETFVQYFGLYRTRLCGPAPSPRYEFAVVLYACYRKWQETTHNCLTEAQLFARRAKLLEVIPEYEKELRSLGIDVKQMISDLKGPGKGSR